MADNTLIKRIARRLGLYHPTDWQIRVKRDEELTTKLLDATLKADSNCIDVGANVGAFLKQFTLLAPQGHHLAFEPISDHALRLSKRFPQVEVYDCALSNKEGSVNFFYVPNRDAWSGLRRQQYPNSEQPVEIEVQLKRMDDIVGDRHVDFIKIDVEGAEYEVLQGARETLRRCRPTVLFEHARIHNENYGTTPQMIFDFFHDECDMQITSLDGSQTFDRSAFAEVYEASFRSNYDRFAQTNFLASRRI